MHPILRQPGVQIFAPEQKGAIRFGKDDPLLAAQILWMALGNAEIRRLLGEIEIHRRDAAGPKPFAQRNFAGEVGVQDVVRVIEIDLA
jgi:hypothetical protein